MGKNDERYEPVCVGTVKVGFVTEKALKVECQGEEVWIPKSQICEGSEVTAESRKGTTGTLTIPRWLADEKALAEE